jgi:DNA (cytosine-5)-methyltransferase 1
MTAAPAAVQDLQILDLFAGAGGFSAGFHAAGGYRTVRAVEMDPTAAATFAANFGDESVFNGPIADWLAEDDVPAVDVVIGGPPCQGFSTLGSQDAEDFRNELWREYAQTVVKAQSKYFVIENVGAFLRSSQFRALSDATGPLGLLNGYRSEAAVLNAADFGAAQLRKRTIVIGHHRDLESPGMPTPTHAGPYRTVRDVIGRITSSVVDTELPEKWTSWQGGVLPGKFNSRQLHVTRNFEAKSLARFRCIPEGGNRTNLPPHLLSACWAKHKTGSMDVMGRLRWDRPSVTIRTEFWKPEKGRYLHPTEDRAITHFEAARIQGFPDAFRWVGSKTAIGRQIGNAVPIPLGLAIAEHLASLLR